MGQRGTGAGPRKNVGQIDLFPGKKTNILGARVVVVVDGAMRIKIQDLDLKQILYHLRHVIPN